MRKSKKNIVNFVSGGVSVALAIAVLLSFAAPIVSAAHSWKPAASNIPFSDSQAHWARTPIAWAYANDITRGTSPTAFTPDGNVTRGQFVAFLHRMEAMPEAAQVTRFADVPGNHTFIRPISWAVEAGVVHGTSYTAFQPEAHITREQMAAMLHRYIRNIRTTHITAPAHAIDSFPDRGSVSPWALDSVRWAAYYGVLGRDGRLNPRGNATRAEAVAMLSRVANDFLTAGRTPSYTVLPPPPTYTNPLTGMPVSGNIYRNRPVAVLLGNTRGAMPTNATNGISQADIVYEILMEYGETRLIALYQDFSTASLVGSIRSVRHYTAQIAAAHDAILFHAGGSQPGIDEVNELGITSFNEVHGPGRSIFRRDVNRIPDHTVDLYHSAVTTGAAATAGFSRYRTRTTLRSDFNNTLSFTDNPIATGGARAHNVNISFSRQKSSSFTFDQQQNLYTMHQRGSVFKDANNGVPVTFTNLIILRMETPFLALYPGDTRLDINTIGRGTGYFVSNGRVIELNWSRADKSSQFVFTRRDGSAIELGRGKTYIGIIPTSGASVNVSFS